MGNDSVVYLTDLEHERWLQDQYLDKFADPSVMVGRTVERREKGDTGIPVPWSKLHGLYSIPSGGITIIGGYSGSNKSTMANQMCVHAASCGKRVAIASLELPADYVFEMMAEQAAVVPTPHESYLSEFAQWSNQKIFFVDTTQVLEPVDVIEMIRVAKTLLGCDVFLLDCLMQINLSTELEAEKAFITRLSTLARELEMAVILVHHVRKASGDKGERHIPNKADLLGSSHLVNASASVLLLWKDPDMYKEDRDRDKPDFLLNVAKSRYMPFQGTVGLYQSDKARVLCNNRHRQYQPIDLRRDECLTSIESPVATKPSGLTTSETPTSTSEIEPVTMSKTDSLGRSSTALPKW